MNKKSARLVTTVFACTVFLSACETMQPATYANFGDNTFALRKFGDAKVRVSSINDQSHFDSGCRMVGPIKTAGNRPIAEFIKDSFNDELKFAGAFSDDQSAVQLTAALQSASFSSMTGLTQGHWSFSLQISNPTNGRSVTSNAQYEFDSGFSADVACRNVSNALTPAVQRLIYKAVSDPSFQSVIGR